SPRCPPTPGTPASTTASGGSRSRTRIRTTPTWSGRRRPSAGRWPCRRWPAAEGPVGSGTAPTMARTVGELKDTFYVTSAIYYANDLPHVGHTYEIVACDVIARCQRKRGEKVWFLNGKDEQSNTVMSKA